MLILMLILTLESVPLSDLPRLNGRKYVVGDQANPITLASISEHSSSRGHIGTVLAVGSGEPETRTKPVVVSLRFSVLRRARSEH